METNTQMSEFTRRLFWKLPKFTFFPKFCKMPRKLIWSLVMTADHNSDKTCIILNCLWLQSRDLVDGVKSVGKRLI